MKLTQSDLPLLFSETVIPDIFFAEYLSQMPIYSIILISIINIGGIYLFTKKELK